MEETSTTQSVSQNKHASEFPDQLSCRNLHADDIGLTLLSRDVQTIISPFDGQFGGSLYISSLIGDVRSPGRRRGPSRAKRQSWQSKSSYQRKRCTKRLRPWQVGGLFEADRFAREIGLPLTAFLTISWSNTRRGGKNILKRFQQAVKCMTEWFRRRGLKTAWVYSHENPGGSEPHFHMLLHLTKRHRDDFERKTPAWFDATDGGVHLRWRVGPSDRCLAYMVKGTDFITARQHGANARRQGTIEFKRAGWSESLGQKAMTRFADQNRE